MPYSLLYDPKKNRPMRVACFMSGSGTNAIKIIEHSKDRDSNYEVVLIFTDVRDDRLDEKGEKICNAMGIAKKYRLPYECIDIQDFYSSRGHKSTKDLGPRPEYYREVLEKIEPYHVDLIALAGYMRIITKPLLERYSGRIINVHPADLSVMDGNKRKYTGIHAVRDTILAGERYLHSTIHIVREKVDYGEILMISEPVEVRLREGYSLEDLKKPENESVLNEIVKENQERLKKEGDWIIYPMALKMISTGRFGLDDQGNVYLDGKLMSNGYRLEDCHD